MSTDFFPRAELPSSDVFRLRIDAIAAGAEGIGRLEGKSVFVRGTAPGDTALCRVVEDHRSWARAELVEVIEGGGSRITPVCPYYGICGGCDLQHIDYEAQLAAKTAIIKDCFSRIGGFTPIEPEIVPSPPWEYRNRMQFHCFPEENGQNSPARAIGLKARKSGGIVPVTDCPIADKGIRAMLRDAGTAKSRLRPFPGKERFTVYARNGLFLYEGGPRQGAARLLDKEITLDISVFFQSNGFLLETLIADLRELAAGADHSRAMADLYCGVGTFSIFLNDFFPHIDLLEENRDALTLARENLLFHTPGANASFFAVKDTRWVKTEHGDYGFIVADPPRQGLAPALSGWLAERGPPLFAYVSCDPATLARDSKILRAGGYELVRLRFYDFYPQTAHIESLAVFARQ
ncbi:MAG TPA: class I SAM-dependent RNA methyltransferase [Treponema sp.]|nr:class I SAM-dependent RNA methyltransferase [Treponema sp.]